MTVLHHKHSRNINTPRKRRGYFHPVMGILLIAAALIAVSLPTTMASQPPGFPPTSQPSTQPDTKPGLPTFPGLPTPEETFIRNFERIHGKEQWVRKNAIRANIEVTFGEEVYFKGSMLHEIATGKTRMELEDGTVLIYDGARAWVSPASAKIEGARFHLLTWPYFLSAPMKTGDPGTHLELLGLKVINKRMCKSAKLTFNPGIGDTPDDWYMLYASSRNELLYGMVYIMTYSASYVEAEKNPHAIIYDGYQKIDGITLSTSWSFYEWEKIMGVGRVPIGRARLTDLEFITPEAKAFIHPSDAREDKLPGS